MATEAYPAVEVTLCGYPKLASARVLWEGEPEARRARPWLFRGLPKTFLHGKDVAPGRDQQAVAAVEEEAVG
jgi:hypothetical protein